MKKRWMGVLAMLLCVAMMSPALAVELSDYAKGLAQPQEGLVDGEKTLELTWLGWNPSGILPTDDSALQQIVESRFNVNITNVPVDVYNSEQLNVMLATGVEFDVTTQSTSFAKLAELGLIRAVDEDMLKTYAPVQIGALEEEIGADWVAYGSVDGTLYGIPQVTASWASPIGLGVRMDWYEAVGGDPANPPKTLDELEALLVKFHTDDPDGNGAEDTYALGYHGDIGTYEYGAYGLSHQYWYSAEDGSPMTYAVDPTYKEVLKVMQRWYKEGIYDPEVVLDRRDESNAKLVAGKHAGLYSIDWGFAREGGANAPIQIAATQGIELPDYMLLPPVSGPGGIAATRQFGVPVSTSGVSFGRVTSDEKVIRILQIMDAFFADEAMWKYGNYGEKDLMYTEDADGNLSMTDKNDNEHLHQYGVQRFFNFNFMPKAYLRWRLTASRYGIYQQVIDYPVIAPNVASAFTTAADTEYGASIDKIRDEFFWKGFTGEIDIDAEWDSYVNNWLAAGGQEVLDAKKALWESMQ